MVNYYKKLPEIKEILKKKGYNSDIPNDIFAHTLMICFGMKKDTTRKWISNFEEINIIKIEGDKVNFL